MRNLVIFDLDGTLLNTIADLAQSTNFALAQLGFPAHDEKEYNFMVGNGINKLFERALPDGEKTDENIKRVREVFLPYYSQHNADKSSPYPGIEDILDKLVKKGVRIAVASNKYHEATVKLVNHYFPQIPFVAVYGHRDGEPAKPAPNIVRDIIAKAECQPIDVLYVGDSGVDMQTALNANVTACGVTWGFRPVEELNQYTPAYIANRPEDILNFL